MRQRIIFSISLTGSKFNKNLKNDHTFNQGSSFNKTLLAILKVYIHYYVIDLSTKNKM